MREHLGLTVDGLRRTPLDCLADLQVQQPPFGADQRVIQGVGDERVLEAIGAARRHAALRDEPGIDQFFSSPGASAR